MEEPEGQQALAKAQVGSLLLAAQPEVPSTWWAWL